MGCRSNVTSLMARVKKTRATKTVRKNRMIKTSAITGTVTLPWSLPLNRSESISCVTAWKKSRNYGGKARAKTTLL